MYEPHERLSVPADPNVKIWRYISLDKFISLLMDQSLYFCRLDMLGDPFEGAVSQASAAQFVDLFASLEPSDESDEFSSEKTVKALTGQGFEFVRKAVFVNCWHVNEYENMAMWQIYSSEGVAIQSTFSRLTQCFERLAEHRIRIGLVQYRDYATDLIDIHWLWDSVLSKRKSFEYEHELRAGFFFEPLVPHGEDQLISDYTKADHPTGINVTINLGTLVERVYVSPRRPVRFKGIIESVLSKYGLDKPVEHSTLLAAPTWLEPRLPTPNVRPRP